MKKFIAVLCSIVLIISLLTISVSGTQLNYGEKIEIYFSSRHVRGEKYFSAFKRASEASALQKAACPLPKAGALWQKFPKGILPH